MSKALPSQPLSPSFFRSPATSRPHNSHSPVAALLVYIRLEPAYTFPPLPNLLTAGCWAEEGGDPDPTEDEEPTPRTEEGGLSPSCGQRACGGAREGRRKSAAGDAGPRVEGAPREGDGVELEEVVGYAGCQVGEEERWMSPPDFVSAGCVCRKG